MTCDSAVATRWTVSKKLPGRVAPDTKTSVGGRGDGSRGALGQASGDRGGIRLEARTDTVNAFAYIGGVSPGGVAPDVILTSWGVTLSVPSSQTRATNRRRRHYLARAHTLPSGVGNPTVVVVRNKGPPPVKLSKLRKWDRGTEFFRSPFNLDAA
ncbi:hypothetical protein B0H14DRAFT_2593397 [Mycena olivaceomarginata]|nr:hypothetical protein B0H14DRAFT_2593397 [Mycena olivaceomarginata]